MESIPSICIQQSNLFFLIDEKWRLYPLQNIIVVYFLMELSNGDIIVSTWVAPDVTAGGG